VWVSGSSKGLFLWSSLATHGGTGLHMGVRANSYYRVTMPFRVAQDLGIADEVFIEGVTSVPPQTKPEERVVLPLLSDVITLGNVFGDGLVRNINTIKELRATIDAETLERVYPPVTVFDQDDLTEYVSIFNHAYAGLGTRGPNGEELVEGAKIYATANDGTNEPKLLWQDGECPRCLVGQCLPGGHQTFDLARNKESLGKIYALARACHGATFTTEPLRAHYRDVVGLEHTYVFPNSIYEPDFPRVELAPHPGEVRILWQGGSSHFEDWMMVAGSLRRVFEKYPQAKMIIWGQMFKWLVDEIPPGQMEFLPWVPHASYHLKLATLGHDINLAPLRDTLFNRCKSAIKWYESSAIERPAATIASNVTPYGDEIEHGETGLLFDTPTQFEEQLSELIEDAEKRQRLAQNAKDWVYTHRDARKTVPALAEWWLSLREQYGEPVPAYEAVEEI
jgi:hypothetical protein